MTVPEGERIWEEGWEGHASAQKRRLARLPLGEKLRWLEEAQRLLRHLHPKRRPEANGPD